MVTQSTVPDFYTIYYDAIGVFVPSTSGGGSLVVLVRARGIEIPPPLPFIPTPEEPVVIEVPFIPFNFSPFIDLFKFEQFELSDVDSDLIEGDAADGGGSSAGSDDDEDDDEKKKRAKYSRQVDNWNTYYLWDASSGTYSSFKLFGQPAPGATN